MGLPSTEQSSHSGLALAPSPPSAQGWASATIGLDTALTKEKWNWLSPCQPSAPHSVHI